MERKDATSLVFEEVEVLDAPANYTNNVHSGVINLAMESLLKMELAQKREKPHGPRGMEEVVR